MIKRIRLRTVAIFTLVGVSGGLLLHTSQNVQRVEKQLADLNKDVNHEKETIHLLKTEWAFLNNPQRLETLAREYLKLQPSGADQIKTNTGAIPSRPVELPDEDIMQAQPVSYTSTPPSLPSPPKIVPLKSQPKEEKTFNDLIDQVSKEGGQ